MFAVIGGSSYGYFSNHKQTSVENSETQNIQQETTNESIETAPVEPSHEDTNPPIQEAEKKKTDEPIAPEVVLSQTSDDKKKDQKKEKTKKEAESSGGDSVSSLSKETGMKKEEDSKKDSKPCFTIDGGVRYSEDIYYRKAFTLNGTCSKNANKFEWYINDKKIGTGTKLPIPLTLLKFGYGVIFEIKLVVISSDGISENESKKISLRKIPVIEACITHKSSETKELELNKEIDFDASCTGYDDENPITQYSWTFRDGENGEKETGKKVSHSFSKGATTFKSSACDNGAEMAGLEVEVLFETKLGFNQSVIYQYCIKK